jgi:predicted membrane channel-forming protein YqfA (hemolysin III family)
LCTDHQKHHVLVSNGIVCHYFMLFGVVTYSRDKYLF